MRRPARWIAAGTAWLVFAVFAGWISGCAAPAPVVVVYDQRDRVESFQTWDWIEGDAVQVHGALGDAARLGEDLSTLVATALLERGLVRAPGQGDLRIAALLVVKRGYRSYRRAGAIQTLHSYHDTGNYEIQVDELVRRPFDQVRLAVFVTGARQERVLWQAQLDEGHLGGLSSNLDEAVTRLFGEFPRPISD